MKHKYSIVVTGRSRISIRKLMHLMEEQAHLSTRGERGKWQLDWSEDFLTVCFDDIADFEHFEGTFMAKNEKFLDSYDFFLAV